MNLGKYWLSVGKRLKMVKHCRASAQTPLRRRCDCLASSAPFTNIQTDLLTDDDLYITNTHFNQKHCRKYTWTSPDGKADNVIDIIFITRAESLSLTLIRVLSRELIKQDALLLPRSLASVDWFSNFTHQQCNFRYKN